MGQSDLIWGNPRFETLVGHGDPRQRLDIAIVGDGYRIPQYGRFRANAQALINEFFSHEPFITYAQHFNFHIVNVFSLDSGTDDPTVVPPVVRRTALDTYFSAVSGSPTQHSRRLLGPDPWVESVVTRSGVPWDFILVIVNSTQFGGGTHVNMRLAYMSNATTDWTRFMVHEAGHSVAKLMDEYAEEGIPDINWPENRVFPVNPPWPNVDTNFSNSKWVLWLTPNVPLPTPDIAAYDGVVGAFRGAAFVPSAVYRPMRRCLMRDRQWPFCRVCEEQWVKVIYGHSSIADGFSPSYIAPQPPLLYSDTEGIRFHASVLHAAGISTTWWTRKQGQVAWRRRRQTDDYADFTTALPADRVAGLPVSTTWEVRCVLQDASRFIRTDDIRRLARQEHIWRLITTPSPVDLDIPDVDIPAPDVPDIPDLPTPPPPPFP